MPKWNKIEIDFHSGLHNSFYDTFIARYPRRSCEAFCAFTLDVTNPIEFKLPQNPSWEEHLKCFERLLKQEDNYDFSLKLRSRT